MLSSRRAMSEVTGRDASGLFEPNEAQFQKLRSLLLMIFHDIADVCEKHGLLLLLGGGSALGAVRHKGMIPWDDDIDLMLPRRDYERFKQVFAAELGDKYTLQAPNAPGCETCNLFMKVILRGTERSEMQSVGMPGDHGIWVDVFPIEYAPQSALMRAVKGFLINALAYLSVSNFMRRSDNEAIRAFMCRTQAARRNYRLRLMLGALTGFIDYHRLYDFFDRAAQGRESDWVTVPTGIRHYQGEMYRARDYLTPAEVEFEGRKIHMPGNVHEYLTGLYGDYMTPPPPEKRERHYYVTLDFGPYGD